MARNPARASLMPHPPGDLGRPSDLAAGPRGILHARNKCLSPVIKHLRRGCVSVLRDGNGAPYRWTAAGLAFKGEFDEAGVPATWVIGEPAARAVAVLEGIQEGRTEWLFAAVRVGPGAGSAGRGGNSALTVAGSNQQLNRFARWVNDYCAATGRGDAIPDVNGRPWRIFSRQFRRTLAWFIARRPGGTIAGAIQYRHHSIQMFQGYAGTSDSGFRAEVEAETHGSLGGTSG